MAEEKTSQDSLTGWQPTATAGANKRQMSRELKGRRGGVLSMTEGVERGCFCINTHIQLLKYKSQALYRVLLHARLPILGKKNPMRNKRLIKCVIEGKSEWFSVSTAEWHYERVSFFSEEVLPPLVSHCHWISRVAVTEVETNHFPCKAFCCHHVKGRRLCLKSTRQSSVFSEV